jgi:tRNA(His) guanylyltransferase
MNKGKDEFGDRMKEYEMMEAGRKFLPLLPVVARLDGKNFSNWTQGLERPYDERMSKVMVEVTKVLVDKTHSCCGYTQSDEISLVYYSDDYKSQIYFDGRIMKMTSVLASIASVHFNIEAHLHLGAHTMSKPPAYFDCRVWQLPNIIELINNLLWRELDCTKNSVSMAARHYYSHNQLLDLGRADMMDLLMEKGVNWDSYPSFFKRGTYVQRKKVLRKFTTEELQNLPEKHEARINPDLKVERSEIVVLDMPPLSRVLNREGVIFRGENPTSMEHISEESPRLKAYREKLEKRE